MSDSRAAIWFSAARPRTLPAAIAPVIVGSALAWRDHAFDLGAAALCLVFALLVQIGTNFANDYYDFIKGADTATRVGPRRAVAAGLIAPAVMHRAMIACFATAFICGLGLIKWGGPSLLVVGIASIACGFAYTGGPWPLAYLGLGDVFVFVFFGVVAVCATYFVQAGRVGRDALLASIPVGLLATNILVVNNYRDIDTDAKAGKRTLAVRLGRRFSRVQFNLFWFVALVVIPLLVACRRSEPWVCLPILLAPLAWHHGRRLKEKETPTEQIRLLGDTGKLLVLYAIAFVVSVVLARA